MPFIDGLFESLDNTFAGGLAAMRSLFSGAPEEEQPPAPAFPPPQIADQPIVINGVALPQTVIDQLRQHGFNPQWCSRCELEAAEQEALVDGTVFHDPDGNNFFDDLELTPEEQKEAKVEEEIEKEEDEDDDNLALAREFERLLEEKRYRANLHVGLPLPIRADTVKKDKENEEPGFFLPRSFRKELSEERRREREKKCTRPIGHDAEAHGAA